MATAAEMERLRRALTTEGQYVEIDRHLGKPSASAAVATETAREAAAQNARGEHIARIIDAERVKFGTGRRFECGVDHEQARERLARGARYLGPDVLRP